MNKTHFKAISLFVFILSLFLIIGYFIRLIIMYYHPGYSPELIIALKNVSFALCIADICIYLIIALIFLSYSLKDTAGKQSRSFFILLFLSFIITAISLMIRIFYVFFVTEDPIIFYNELFERTELTQGWAIIQVPLLFIGLGFLSLSAEYAILEKKTKYIISIIIIGSSLVIFFLPYDLAIIVQLLPMVALFFMICLLIIIYLYITIENHGLIRKKSIYIAIGLVMVMVFLFMNSQTIMGLLDPTDYRMLESPIIFAPIISIFGCIFLFNGYRVREMDSEEISKIESSSPFIEKLGLDLTKPVDLSEEDVKLYRERTQCLVCKKTIKGFSSIFICPDCRALYCEKCARTLSGLDNECWSCDNAIDKSKPIKHYVKEEEVKGPKDLKKNPKKNN